MLRMVDRSDSRWEGSPSSMSKRILDTRSDPVWVVQVRMLTWWSANAAVTSRSSRARSRALTSIEAMNTPPGSRSHSTSMSRSAWPSASETALAQSARWTETPRPRVTNPMISSPGTGVQHRDSRTNTSSRPSTCTPAGPRGGRGPRRAAARGAAGGAGPAGLADGGRQGLLGPGADLPQRLGHPGGRGLGRHVVLADRRVHGVEIGVVHVLGRVAEDVARLELLDRQALAPQRL